MAVIVPISASQIDFVWTGQRDAYAASTVMSTGAMIGAWILAGNGSSSKYSSRASRRLASACSMLSPWLATSTCRQRATYQSPSCVIAALNWISATLVEQLLERAFGPDAGHFALVGGGAAQVV